MKLILVILRGDGDKLTQILTDQDYRVTEFSSVGGFLRRRHTTLLIGVADEQVDTALGLIREANPATATTDEHYATIFVLDAESFVSI
ncbi:MAG TPA: cyclic-di-AMP receptor [Aggregatilineaceae bacterium]|nr:cyclic-di-AMP receptor [Aggregatilineaceae bacterium]